MTKFEQIGVNQQMDAATIGEALRSFQWSCRCCCTKGMRLECDRCAIRATHYNTVAILNDQVVTTKPEHQRNGKSASSCTDLVGFKKK